jgi:hypothetical protein
MWWSMHRWSKDTLKLTPKEQVFIGQLAYRLSHNLSVTYKQAKWAFDIKDKAEDLGWKF